MRAGRVRCWARRGIVVQGWFYIFVCGGRLWPIGGDQFGVCSRMAMRGRESWYTPKAMAQPIVIGTLVLGV